MNERLNRRDALARLAAVTAAVVALPKAVAAQGQQRTAITVYKDPSCGCCHLWVEHLQANGFSLTVIDTGKMADIKMRYKVGSEVQSCHTAVIGEYVIEGHVPASDIRKLLAAKPKNIVGLSIPACRRARQAWT
ncbi:MAG: DUF411 domain-containing protein [Gemmatimonadales bacterium]